MDKEKIVKIIKSKTKGIYSETFYGDLANEILGIRNPSKIPMDFSSSIIEYFDIITSEEKVYSRNFNNMLRAVTRLVISDKRIMMYLKEYSCHLGCVLFRGKDIKGRYFILTRFEPK